MNDYSGENLFYQDISPGKILHFFAVILKDQYIQWKNNHLSESHVRSVRSFCLNVYMSHSKLWDLLKVGWIITMRNMRSWNQWSEEKTDIIQDPVSFKSYWKRCNLLVCLSVFVVDEKW